MFDERSDLPIDEPAIELPAGSGLILDGLFLHRPELVDVWSLSVSSSPTSGGRRRGRLT